MNDADHHQEEIFGSAYASAVYLSRVVNFPKDKKVYVIGQEGIEEELDAVGIQHVGGTVSLRQCDGPAFQPVPPGENG